MPTNADLANQMSALVNSWQTYIDQQIALDNGVATYVAPGPVGGVSQPGPGYYPVTMPNGITVWRPCIDRIRVDAQTFQVVADQRVSGSIAPSENGRVMISSNTGGNTNITRTLPTGLGTGFHAIYIFNNITAGSTGTMTFNAATGATINNDQALFKMRGRFSMASIVAIGASTYVIQGSLIA
jgi:hypothetical protein